MRRIDFGYSCMRSVFFAYNGVFWVLGIVSVGVGAWLYTAKNEYHALTPRNYGATSAAGLFLAAGATILVIGLVGCCAAYVHSRRLLITYLVFLMVIFVVMLTVGVLGLMYRTELGETIRLEMHSRMNGRYITDAGVDPYGIHITWDKIQKDFSCCGVDKPQDWYRSPRWPINDWVPDSCCKPEASRRHCGQEADPKLWYSQGCYDAFRDWLLEHMHTCGFIGLTFAAIQVFGLTITALLICRRRDRFASASDHPPTDFAGGVVDADRRMDPNDDETDELVVKRMQHQVCYRNCPEQ